MALLCLSGCGKTEDDSFETMEVIGQRHYNLLFRLNDRIAPLVNAAMAQLYDSGELSSASLRWLGRDAIDLDTRSVPLPQEGGEDGTEAEAETPAERTLIVGVEADFEPMAYEDNGILRGMSVDIAASLGVALGWGVRCQPITASEVEAQLASGNIDVALGFDPGTVREGKYTVGVEYMESDIVLSVRRSGVNSLRELRDQRIGTVDDPSVIAAVKADERITRYASGATVYLSARRCISALDNGWCAAIAMDEIMLEHAAKY